MLYNKLYKRRLPATLGKTAILEKTIVFSSPNTNFKSTWKKFKLLKLIVIVNWNNLQSKKNKEVKQNYKLKNQTLGATTKN